MRSINLTRGKVAFVDDIDYPFLNQWKWHAVCIRKDIWYAARSQRIKGTKKSIHYKMHRVIMNLTDPKELCDHINHDVLDNRRSNLRVATQADNARNKTSARNSSSRFLGVYLHKGTGKWRAKIATNGKSIYLGTYTNEIDAAFAYNRESLKYYGKFANLNQA